MIAVDEEFISGPGMHWNPQPGNAMNPWLKRYRHHCAPMTFIRFGKLIILHSKQLLISGQPAGSLSLMVDMGIPFKVDAWQSLGPKDGEKKNSEPQKSKKNRIIHLLENSGQSQIVLNFANPSIWTLPCSQKNLFTPTRMNDVFFKKHSDPWKKMKKQPSTFTFFPNHVVSEESRKFPPPEFSPPRRPWQQPVQLPSKIHRT